VAPDLLRAGHRDLGMHPRGIGGGMRLVVRMGEVGVAPADMRNAEHRPAIGAPPPPARPRRSLVCPGRVLPAPPGRVVALGWLGLARWLLTREMSEG